jgi:hypothetical protein
VHCSFFLFFARLDYGFVFIWSICFFLKQKMSVVVNTNTATIKRTRHCTCVLFVRFVRFVRLKCARLKCARLKCEL